MIFPFLEYYDIVSLNCQLEMWDISMSYCKVKKTNVIVRTMIPLLMAFLLVASIAAAFYFHIDRDVYTMANAVICIFAALLLFILLVCLVSSPYIDKKQYYLFCAIVVALFLSTLIGGLRFMLTGLFNMGEKAFLLYNVSYFLISVAWILFLLYQRSNFLRTKAERIFIRVSIAIPVLILSALIYNYFFRCYSTVDCYGSIVYLQNPLVLTLAYVIVYLQYLVYLLVAKGEAQIKWLMVGCVIVPFLDTTLCSAFFLARRAFRLESLDYICNVIALYLLFFNIYQENTNRLLIQERKIAQQAQQQAELQTAIMLSQIAPHFLSNALSCISGLCLSENAPKSRTAINVFSDYLRSNIGYINKKCFIPFEKELEHIKAYLWLEQLRFGEDLRVEYDIQYALFALPSLVVQPLVENAVKHGIIPKNGSGTVRICTEKTEDGVRIIVADDGVGFDATKKQSDNKIHIGIQNVERRLQIMCNGALEIRSRPGVGTTATITIFRGG